ncbi:MAG: hypothetical protein Q7R54_02895 [bacterium]|nr:hypothetical protein [bacterium]
MKYSVSSSGSPRIRGAAAIRKQKQRFDGISGWLPNFLELKTIWEFTDRSTGLLGPTIGNYESDLASEALDGGIILDRRFLAEVCKEAEIFLADLQLEIDNAYSPRLRLARNA